MNFLDALSVTDNFKLEGFHNIIVNLFDVIQEYTPMILSHAISQIEPKILLEVDAIFHNQVSIHVIANTICLIPSPELLHGYILSLEEIKLVSSKFLCLFLAFCQNHLIFLKS